MVRFLVTIVAFEFYSACCLHHGKNHIQCPWNQIACRYDCCRVLKHVSKAHNILLHNNLKQVGGLIYMERLESQTFLGISHEIT